MDSSSSGAVRQPRLLEVVRERIRTNHYSRRTERAYVGWIRRFIRFHHRRHPREMGEAEVVAFLSSLATHGRVAASLMYGSGLRLLECAELRVKDVDLASGEIRFATARDGRIA